MPNVSSVTSEIEEIYSFCIDAEDDNDDESAHVVHSTEPNEIDYSTKHDPINVAVKKKCTFKPKHDILI